MLHQRKLSASEKRQKIQLLKAAGNTQKQVADELECSIRLVKYYWSITELISKKESIKLDREAKRANDANILGISKGISVAERKLVTNS